MLPELRTVDELGAELWKQKAAESDHERRIAPCCGSGRPLAGR
jgi:hypothetical protein